MQLLITTHLSGTIFISTDLAKITQVYRSYVVLCKQNNVCAMKETTFVRKRINRRSKCVSQFGLWFSFIYINTDIKTRRKRKCHIPIS